MCGLQDANIFVSENDAKAKHQISLGPARQAYLVNVEGSLIANGIELATRDAITFTADSKDAIPISLTAGSNGCHFMLIELAASA